jgi:ACR3 family arsenite transporter
VLIWKVASYLNKQLTIVIPVMLVAGFAYGMLFDARPLQSAILPLTFLMVYPMMVSLRMEKVFSFSDLRVQGVAQLINFGVVPFVALGIGLLFFRDQHFLLLGFVLAGLVPTSGMTLSYTGLAKGNREAALKITVLGLVLGSLLTPFYAAVLVGARVPMDMAIMMRTIATVIFVPLVAGYLTQRLMVARTGEKAFYETWAPRIGPVSTFGVAGMVFVAIALKAKVIAAQPQLVLLILAPLAILYALNYLLSSLIGRAFFSREDAVALVFGTVMRNLSVALAIAMNAFGAAGSEAALIIALAYVIQVQSAAWFVKFSDGLLTRPPRPSPAA